MPIATEGYEEIEPDRYLLPSKVEPLSPTTVRITQPYAIRVGAVTQNKTVTVIAGTDDDKMADAWNSIFYAINQGTSGEVLDTLYPMPVPVP